MRLLVVTQTIDQNDPILGFMVEWVAELAAKCEQVTVLCLKKGAHNLPSGVRVFSLGKEQGESRWKYLLIFFRIIWRERAVYDGVFVHMNQIYVLLGGIIWRALGKKIILWYAHGHVPLSLRAAEKLTHRILTSTATGCRLASAKVRIIGQGIDTDYFVPSVGCEANNAFRIIALGRISPVKDYETLLTASAELAARIPELKIIIVGGVGTPEQDNYFISLKQLVEKLNLTNRVRFAGPCNHAQTRAWFWNADVFVNTGLTGSLDKAIVEAMACGAPVLTCNEAAAEALGSLAARLMFEKKNVIELADKIQKIYDLNNEERGRLGQDLRALAVRDHGLKNFVAKIFAAYSGI